MEIRVLKVRREENLDELKGVITTGHTVIGQGQGGWQVPAPSQIGDLAVWYSGDPQQKFVAYGWVCGLPGREHISAEVVRCIETAGAAQ